MGYPTVFVRTSGCHLRCHYCDTKYAYHEGHKMSLDELMTKIESYPTKFVCLTGGEPLLQKHIYPLMDQLILNNYVVSLETSGDKDCKDVPLAIHKIIDVKTPDSGETGKFHPENLKFKSDPKTEYKFVICSDKDLVWTDEFCKEQDLYNSPCAVWVSPSFEDYDLKKLAESVLQHYPQLRMQIQLHKHIWGAETTGV